MEESHSSAGRSHSGSYRTAHRAATRMPPAIIAPCGAAAASRRLIQNLAKSPRSIDRSDRSAGTTAGTHLPQPQAPGAYRRLPAAVALADPLPITNISIGRQLTEPLAAAKRGRTRSIPPCAGLLRAPTVLHDAALHLPQSGCHQAAAPAAPQPSAGAAISERREIAVGAASHVATRRKGPFGR